MAKTQTIVLKSPAKKGKSKSRKKMDWKKYAVQAGLGAALGLAVKYGGAFLTKNAGPDAQELVRRGANVAAAFGGQGVGEMAYQVADFAINRAIVIPTGGSPVGSLPGETA